MKLLIIIFLCALVPNLYGARPNPQKTTAEVLNDAYNDLGDLDPMSGSLNVTLTSTALGITTIAKTIKEGTLVDFTTTNILDSGYTDIVTLSNDVQKMSITHNGGGKFVLRVDSADVGYIAPGEVQYIDFAFSTGSVVRLKSVSGTVSSGELFLNFFGE